MTRIGMPAFAALLTMQGAADGRLSALHSAYSDALLTKIVLPSRIDFQMGNFVTNEISSFEKPLPQCATFSVDAVSRPSEPTCLRLGYLLSQYPGISETFILREILALRELGFDIRVAAINVPDRDPRAMTATEREEGLGTRYIKRSRWYVLLQALLRCAISHPLRFKNAFLLSLQLGATDRKRRLLGLYYFLEAALVADWVRKESLPHLHVHFATPASTVGLIASKLSNTPLSITIHGPDEFYDVSRYHLAEKIAGCTFLRVIGKFARSQLMKYSPVEQWAKFEVTPLGVDPNRFAARPPRKRGKVFEILCVGRLVPAKGQHVLIQAVARLAKKEEPVFLRLVGDGPDRESLQEQAESLGVRDRVLLEGPVNQDHIQEYYRRADVFVLPSFAEGIPIVLMEAMAMEVPCITTRITGIPELIRDGIEGFLVTPSDDEELALAIARLIREPDLCRTLGEAGRRRILACYDLRVNVRHLAGVLRQRLEA